MIKKGVQESVCVSVSVSESTCVVLAQTNAPVQ